VGNNIGIHNRNFGTVQCLYPMSSRVSTTITVSNQTNCEGKGITNHTRYECWSRCRLRAIGSQPADDLVLGYYNN